MGNIYKDLKNRILKAVMNMDIKNMNSLFLEVFEFQFKNNEVYRKYCLRQDKKPSNIFGLKDIPLLPVRFFKRYNVRSFKGKVELFFLSSGTTEGTRSKVFYRDRKFIEKSILLSFEYFVLKEKVFNFYIFFPPFEVQVNSSLSFMFHVISRNFSEKSFYIYKKTDYRDIYLRLKKEKKPLLICGTTLSLFDFLNFLKNRGLSLELPYGSKIVDTGGFKTKKMNLSKRELFFLYSKLFGIEENFIVNEYGMCELGSQFYDAVLVKEKRYKFSLPFLRFRILNELGREDREGVIGIYDLFNIDTCSFLLVPDLVYKRYRGFEIVERIDEDLRGCSLISEKVLL